MTASTTFSIGAPLIVAVRDFAALALTTAWLTTLPSLLPLQAIRENRARLLPVGDQASDLLRGAEGDRRSGKRSILGGGNGGVASKRERHARPDIAVAAYQGVFDLNGNVFEWTDLCVNTVNCYALGGNFAQDPPFETCTAPPNIESRMGRFSGVGFRCCAR